MGEAIDDRARRIFRRAMWPDDDGLKMITEELTAAYQQGLEDAAKVADGYPLRDPGEDGNGYWAAQEIAAAIRSLQTKD